MVTPADPLCTRLNSVLAAIANAELQKHSQAGRVGLVLVSKGQPASLIRQAHACGQNRFGENYVREAIVKIQALRDLPVEWHFIGPLQANKTRLVAERFAWVHSIDRLKIAQRLAAQRPSQLPALQVCVQVNISDEPSKSGVSGAQVALLAREVAALPGLRLRGLMAIGAAGQDMRQQRYAFARLHSLLEELNARDLMCDTLSMGMSGDFPAAIAEGATLVRIGQAVFGPRGSA